MKGSGQQCLEVLDEHVATYGSNGIVIAVASYMCLSSSLSCNRQIACLRTL
jgi:hypothetical protein